MLAVVSAGPTAALHSVSNALRTRVSSTSDMAADAKAKSESEQDDLKMLQEDKERNLKDTSEKTKAIIL